MFFSRRDATLSIRVWAWGLEISVQLSTVILDTVAMRVHETVSYEAARKFKVHIVEGVMEEQVARLRRKKLQCIVNGVFFCREIGIRKGFRSTLQTSRTT